mmetsp:Transcript_1904/g.11624  ORF Transcript_1904/g.11624 Transcript_1904/m.11624 type:complete len:211 (-) Transcript_1904:379-1011(-)
MATSFPFSRSLPLNTCARDAAATGSSEISLKISSGSLPNSCLITCLASSELNGLTPSCSFSSSFVAAGPMTSGRMDSICPSLTKVGPNSSMAILISFARTASSLRNPSRPPPCSAILAALETTGRETLAKSAHLDASSVRCASQNCRMAWSSYCLGSWLTSSITSRPALVGPAFLCTFESPRACFLMSLVSLIVALSGTEAAACPCCSTM